MDEDRLRALLHELYAEGASNVPAPPRREPAPRGLGLRVLAACTALAAVVVALVVLLPSNDSGSPARLVPMATSPGGQPPQPSTGHTPSLSIEITPSPPVPGAPAYLPTGAKLAARSVVSPSGGVVLSYQIAGKANAHQGIDGVIQVWRAPNADGKAKLDSSKPTPGNDYQNITVNGHPGVLTTPSDGLGGYSVEWLADKELVAVSMAHKLTAAGTTGVSVEELLKVAESVP